MIFFYQMGEMFEEHNKGTSFSSSREVFLLLPDLNTSSPDG